jgi:hypothetical protein
MKVGVHPGIRRAECTRAWIPACAGMTLGEGRRLTTLARRHGDGRRRRRQIGISRVAGSVVCLTRASLIPASGAGAILCLPRLTRGCCSGCTRSVRAAGLHLGGTRYMCPGKERQGRSSLAVRRARKRLIAEWSADAAHEEPHRPGSMSASASAPRSPRLPHTPNAQTCRAVGVAGSLRTGVPEFLGRRWDGATLLPSPRAGRGKPGTSAAPRRG